MFTLRTLSNMRYMQVFHIKRGLFSPASRVIFCTVTMYFKIQPGYICKKISFGCSNIFNLGIFIFYAVICKIFCYDIPKLVSKLIHLKNCLKYHKQSKLWVPKKWDTFECPIGSISVNFVMKCLLFLLIYCYKRLNLGFATK